MSNMRVRLRVGDKYFRFHDAYVTFALSPDDEIVGMSFGEIQTVATSLLLPESVGNAIAAAYRDGWEQRGQHERAKALTEEKP